MQRITLISHIKFSFLSRRKKNTLDVRALSFLALHAVCIFSTLKTNVSSSEPGCCGGYRPVYDEYLPDFFKKLTMSSVPEINLWHVYCTVTL